MTPAQAQALLETRNGHSPLKNLVALRRALGSGAAAQVWLEGFDNQWRHGDVLYVPEVRRYLFVSHTRRQLWLLDGDVVQLASGLKVKVE